MNRKTKAKAIELLVAKRNDPSLTYADIERKTGYSRRQLIRISKQIDERGAAGAAEHGNAGRKPATAATEDEVRYLREFKKPYRSITIAQFRDIFIEDVIENPDRLCIVNSSPTKSASGFRHYPHRLRPPPCIPMISPA